MASRDILQKQLEYEQLGRLDDYEGNIPTYERRRREEIANLLAHFPNGIILDVGCGYGTLIKGFTKIFKIIGLDVNINYLKICNLRDILPLLGDARKIPLADDSVDIVIAAELIEHFSEPDVILKEIQRVLKRKGRFIITIPNLRSLHSLTTLILLNSPLKQVFQPVHFSYFTKKTLSRILMSNGLKPLHWRTNEVFPAFLFQRKGLIFISRFLNLLNRLANRLFVGWGLQLIVEGSVDKEVVNIH